MFAAQILRQTPQGVARREHRFSPMCNACFLAFFRLFHGFALEVWAFLPHLVAVGRVLP